MQLTIRDVDERLRNAIQHEATTRGLSLNRTLLLLLRQATGLQAPAARPEYDDLDDLSGTWSTEEAEDFDRVLADQRVIEEGLWKPRP